MERPPKAHRCGERQQHRMQQQHLSKTDDASLATNRRISKQSQWWPLPVGIGEPLNHSNWGRGQDMSMGHGGRNRYGRNNAEMDDENGNKPRHQRRARLRGCAARHPPPDPTTRRPRLTATDRDRDRPYQATHQPQQPATTSNTNLLYQTSHTESATPWST